MKKDTATTLGGLILVGAVVVATFLYGNHQRQEQLRKDSQAQQQAQAQQNKASDTGTSQNTTTSNTPQQPGVQKPTASPTPLQGGQSGNTAPKPAATPPAAPSQIAAGITQTPKTGGSLLPIIATTLVTASVLYYRRSTIDVRQKLSQPSAN